MILPKEFYLKDTNVVAKKLIGKTILRKQNGINLTGIIVETEAYIGINDPACHAFQKITPRNKIMFEEGGISYVYFIYGNYYCFNIVTGKAGLGNAVLIRAIQPLKGIEHIKLNRKTTKETDMTNGPGKLCMALNITKIDNGIKLYSPKSPIQIKSGKNNVSDSEILRTKRIGITNFEN